MSPEPRHLPASSVNGEDVPSPSQVSRPIATPAMRPCERSISKRSRSREIARRLHLPRQTVRKFLVCESFPERSRSAYQGSILDPYKPYLLGCWNGSQLYSEVKARGYTGSVALFRLFISSVRKQHRAAGTAAALELSADRATVKGPADPAPNPASNAACRKPRARLSVCESSWEAG